MKAIVAFLFIGTFVFACSVIFIIPDRKSPLEKIVIDEFFFSEGSEISEVAQSFEKSLREAGCDWNVVVAPGISKRTANSNCGGTQGSSANVFAYTITLAFDARAWVFEKDGLIIFIDKKSGRGR